ncbi:thioredoxin-domain-containing protein [Pisolithus sp. B1]|nr:thioredoxin-domain-containing protein [Pisolithus croceorrhizus]KAI6136366.1 thioredoxin-domain-containing protein [Pisolithus sp. B1]
MAITHLTSVPQLETLLSASDDKLTVIDFHATWCGPCHAIAPTFEALAKEYPNVNFLKCDVDAAKDVASAYGVRAMPTFVFLKGSKQVHTIKGADKHGLQNALKQLTGPTAGTFPGQGQPLGGSPSTGDGPGNGRAMWANIDPQFKILLALVAAYVFFWLM